MFVSAHLRLSRTLAVMPSPYHAEFSFQSSWYSPWGMAEKKMALVDCGMAFDSLPWFALVVATQPHATAACMQPIRPITATAFAAAATSVRRFVPHVCAPPTLRHCLARALGAHALNTRPVHEPQLLSWLLQ